MRTEGQNLTMTLKNQKSIKKYGKLKPKNQKQRITDTKNNYGTKNLTDTRNNLCAEAFGIETYFKGFNCTFIHTVVIKRILQLLAITIESK